MKQPERFERLLCFRVFPRKLRRKTLQAFLLALKPCLSRPSAFEIVANFHV